MASTRPTDITIRDATAARARAHGCRRMEWTALDWNATARTFYENLDARPMTNWVIYRLEESGIAALSAGRARASDSGEASSETP